MTKYMLSPLLKMQGIKLDGLNTNSHTVVSDTLAKIDDFTSYFNDEEELKNYLKKFFKLDDDEKLYIYYEYKKQEKRLPILYAKDASFIDYAEEREINVWPGTEHFKKDYRKFLDSSKNEKYLDFMYENGFMYVDLYECLKQYRYYLNSDSINEEENRVKSELEEKIRNYLINYKTLRNLYIGTQKYRKFILHSDPIIPKVDNPYMEEEQEIYSTQEEQNEADIYRYASDEEIEEFGDMIPENVKKRIEADYRHIR